MYLGITLALLISFGCWTALTLWIDVQPIGPLESNIGLATINRFFHHLTGVHLDLYVITDWLSLIPLGFVLFFGFLGLKQWIQRKNILKVDYSILILGGFYMLVLALFFLFEEVALNFRPTLINGKLEASYPSSTTMLVLTVMPTTIMQLRSRIRCKKRQKSITVLMLIFTAFMVLGRIISGVHWLSDIIGGILLSAGLVMLYVTVCNTK